MGCIAGWRRPLERKDRSSRSYPDTGYWKVYGGHEMITTHETVHSRGVPSPGPSLCLSFFVNFFPLGVDCLAFFFYSRIVLLLLLFVFLFFSPLLYSYGGVVATPAQEEAVCSYYTIVF